MAGERPKHEQIAEEFVKFYYDSFARDRSALLNVYRPESTLTYEAWTVQGAEAIVQKLQGFTFGRIQHEIVTVDSQALPNGGALVMVTGAMQTDDDPPRKFAQVFQLLPDSAGNLFVHNDIYKMFFG